MNVTILGTGYVAAFDSRGRRGENVFVAAELSAFCRKRESVERGKPC